MSKNRRMFLVVGLLLLMSIFVTSCEDAEIEKLDLSGDVATKLEVEQFTSFNKVYLEESRGNPKIVKNQWYNIEFRMSIENYWDENYCEIKTITYEGSVYESIYDYEYKMELDIIISEKIVNSQYEENTESKGKYIFINGTGYLKMSTKTETKYVDNNDTKQIKEEVYICNPDDYDCDYLSKVKNFSTIEVLDDLTNLLNDESTSYDKHKFYSYDNGIAYDIRDSYTYKPIIYQGKIIFQDDDYRIKTLEVYQSESEVGAQVKKVNKMYYLKTSKLFGFISAPKNLKDYVEN